MKKPSYLLIGLLSAFALFSTSCNSINEVLQNWGSGETDDTTNYAVYTLNAYTDLINNAQDAITALDNDVQNAEYDMTNYDANYGVTFTCNFTVEDRDNLYTETMDPVGLEDSEASELKTQATTIFTTLDSIDGLCKDLHKYVAAQEYKTDNFAKGTSLVKLLYTAIDTYYDAHDAVLKKVDTLFEKYSTWEVDPSDPTSVAIDNMDKDLNQASDILDMVEAAYTNTDYTKVTEIQTLLDALNTAVASHSGSSAPAVPSEYKAQVDAFYNDMDLNFSTAGTVAIRAMNEQNIDDLWTSYSKLLSSYNTMIDTYNSFLDVTGY